MGKETFGYGFWGRVGKGTLFGIKRAEGFLKSNNVWVLRLDIRGFFMSINREILFELVMENLGGEDTITQFLIRKIVFNDPLKNAFFKSPPSAWEGLPKDKSMKYSSPGTGLPIGNLTSQLFANVYLNPLDHFVKRELKIKYYGRYVDDLLLVHSDKEVLQNAIPQIRDFLQSKLKLTLHPKKIKLQPASHGFAFLGAYILPHRKYPGRRVVSNFRKCLNSPLANFEKQISRKNSYLGLLSHFNCRKLSIKLCGKSGVPLLKTEGIW